MARSQQARRIAQLRESRQLNLSRRLNLGSVISGRAGKGKATSLATFPPEVKKQLRLLAAEHDTTIQNLLAEALNDLFAKNGKPEVAPL